MSGTDQSRAKTLATIRKSLKARPQIVAAPPHADDAGPQTAHGLGMSVVEAERPAADVAALMATFRTTLEALTGAVFVMPAAEVAGWLEGQLRERGLTKILSWDQAFLPVPGVLDVLRAKGITVEQGALPRPPAERAQALAEWEQIRFGLTGADAVFAQTATLALRAGAGRPRLASLSVEAHVALVTADQFYLNWAAYLQARGEPAGAELNAASNYVLVSGPSRTGDIEMTLTVGVHGPREVLVVIVT